MKKLLAFTLVLVLFLSFGLTAFAIDNPRPTDNNGGGEGDPGGYDGPVGKYRLYNDKDELIGTIPSVEVLKLDVNGAYSLNKEDSKTFIKYYKSMETITDRKVKYLLWVNIPDSYKTDDLAYMVFDFVCPGKDVQATVNGQSMEVVKIEGSKYYAKMTDFGALMVTRAK